MKTTNTKPFQVGDSAVLEHTITQQDLEQFVSLTGDTNPLHIDPNYAKRTSIKSPVVHGMLTASFISTIIGNHLPGPGALWYQQTLTFLAPARVSEHITVSATITHISEHQQVMILKTEIFNQQGEKIVTGEAKVKLISQEPSMEQQNEKSAIIISGGSGGIGAATAKRLAAEGYAVVINFHQNQKTASELVNEINKQGRAIAIKANIADRNETAQLVSAAIDTFGKIDGIVHCAAAPIHEEPFLQTDWQNIEHQMNIQVKGGFNLAQCTFPYFLEQKHGCMVNVLSTVIDLIPTHKWLSYTLAKTALHTLTKQLATEFGPQNIRVNGVAPGMTLTTMIQDLPERAKLVEKAMTPLRRLAQPDEIASIILFLLSNEATHITGEVIRVCGGSSMR